MLAGTAHILSAMRIFHDVCKEMEISTILTPTINADILAEHASRTKCATKHETMDLVNSIVDNFRKMSLLINSPFSDSLL